MDKFDELMANKENLNREDLLLLIKYLEELNKGYQKEAEKMFRWFKKALYRHQPFPRHWRIADTVRLMFQCGKEDAIAILLACTSYPFGDLEDIDKELQKVYKKSKGDVDTALDQAE